MGGDHHALAGRQIEGRAGGEVDARLGLVVARGLRAQDRVPGKRVAPREIDHQRDVAVGDRREQVPFPELRQARRNIGPAIEPVPGEVEIARDIVLEMPKS